MDMGGRFPGSGRMMMMMMVMEKQRDKKEEEASSLSLATLGLTALLPETIALTCKHEI